MQCPRCHRELSDIAHFCPDCGLKIERNEEAGANEAPASSVLPPLPAVPSSKEEVGSEFVPVSFDNVAPPVLPSYTPATPSPSKQRPLFAPIQQGYPMTSGANIAPVLLNPNYAIDESDYYHIDATECYDFEAFRGISIFLMVISALTVFGIIFPLPLCIVTLVFACLGTGEADPVRAKKRFRTCRALTIISVFSVIAMFVGIYVIRYLANYTGFLDDYYPKMAVKIVGTMLSHFV